MKRAAILAMLVLAACRGPEQTHLHYPSWIEAVRAGQESRGWVPRWMPKSATEIHIQGDIETNARWYRFDLTPPAADSLRQELVGVSPSSAHVRAPVRADAWWLDQAALNADVYRGSGKTVPQEVTVAFDRTTRHVYAWSGLD